MSNERNYERKAPAGPVAIDLLVMQMHYSQLEYADKPPERYWIIKPISDELNITTACEKSAGYLRFSNITREASIDKLGGQNIKEERNIFLSIKIIEGLFAGEVIDAQTVMGERVVDQKNNPFIEFKYQRKERGENSVDAFVCDMHTAKRILYEAAAVSGFNFVQLRGLLNSYLKNYVKEERSVVKILLSGLNKDSYTITLLRYQLSEKEKELKEKSRKHEDDDSSELVRYKIKYIELVGKMSQISGEFNILKAEIQAVIRENTELKRQRRSIGNDDNKDGGLLGIKIRTKDDACNVLGVDPNLSISGIKEKAKERYRLIAKAIHLDLFNGIDPRQKKSMEELLKLINQAKDFIGRL